MTTSLGADPVASPVSPDSPTSRSARAAVRAIAWVAVVTFLIATANALLLSRSHLLDVRLPMLGLGLVLSAPGWLLLALAARARGAAWRWLLVAATWGFFAAPFLAFIAEDRLSGLDRAIVAALAPLGRDVADAGPATIIAPMVEEPAKALGLLLVLLVIRGGGTALTAGLGAAVGGLVGLGFSLTEMSHRLGEMVGNSGYVDVNGAFVIDWDSVWRVELLQLVNRLFALGLSDHAVFSALAGVAIVCLVRRRFAAAVGWFLAALAAHALSNSVGAVVGQWGFSTAMQVLGGAAAGLGATLAAIWIAALAGFVVSQAWAVGLLARAVRRTRS